MNKYAALLLTSTVALSPLQADAGRFIDPHPASLGPGDRYHHMFVTAANLSVDTFPAFPPFLPFFGGIDAADYAVTAYPSGILHTGWNGTDIVYKAVLSDSTQNASDRIGVAVHPVFNTNGDRIADNSTDLWDGTIQNPVLYDEQGLAVPAGTTVWTGTSPDGTASIDNANDWLNPGSTAVLRRTATRTLALTWHVLPIEVHGGCFFVTHRVGKPATNSAAPSQGGLGELKTSTAPAD